MTTKPPSWQSLSLIVFSLLLASPAVLGQMAITYQGQLQQQDQPFTGTANLEFRLFTALAGGSQIGLGQTFVNHPVQGGLFQVELDYSPQTFSAGERFIEVWVNGAPLTPRQPVSAAPLALHALNVPESVSPFSLEPATGAIAHASSTLGVRFEPRPASEPALDSPSITFGRPENAATAAGAVVLGGGVALGPNLAAGEHSVVAGGIDNRAEGFRSFVGGGSTNRATSSLAAVVAGITNHATGSNSFVGGGSSNNAAGSRSTIPGGFLNCAGGGASWAGGTRASVRPDTDANIAVGCTTVPGTPGGDAGTFVWADSQSDRFISSGINQFLIRASGGALITGSSAVNNPEGNRLRVNGTLRVDALGSAGATPLCRNGLNQIADCSSSTRYKRDIEDLAITPELLERLRPVRYHWVDNDQPDIGFVAEEIADLLPELVTRNEQGQIEGIKYDRLTALLVQAMQQDRVRQRQTEALLAGLQADNQQLQEQIAALGRQAGHNARLMQGNAELEARLATLESMLFDGPRIVAQP